jgi:hypothetical protein
MTLSLVAGPTLFAPCLHDARAWITATDRWVKWARRLSLRFVATADYWARLAECGCSPAPPAIRASLSRAGLASSFPSALTLVASLVALTDTIESDGVIIDWEASGCLATRVDRMLAGEVVAASCYLGVGVCSVAGGAMRDEELVRVSALQTMPPQSHDVLVSLNCHPAPDSFVDGLEPVDYATDPRLAIEMASARLSRITSARTSRFDVLPQLGPSLNRLDSNIKRGVIETMAVLLLPPEDRPGGLEEHWLRTGPGANEPQRRGPRGAAWRVDIRMRGTGWRLHLWRGEDGVTFSNVTSESSLLIFD